MSLDGNVCFFVIYHYKTNPILTTPIPGLDLSSILAAHKKNFKYLEEKGYKPKLNIMNNQATKVLKAYLMPNKSAYNSSSHTATMLTQPRKSSKPSKIDSLVH
jgi:hypothetical protein